MRRAAIFMFFDPDGIADRYIEYYLKSLRSVADYILVVANGKLTPESRAMLADCTDDFFTRENIGYDAHAYRTAIRYMGSELDDFDELILCNYTIFGPFFHLGPVFERMSERGADWWGMHRRFEDKDMHSMGGRKLHTEHMPEFTSSNFWVVRKKMLHSREFAEYWDNLPPLNDYIEACIYHEPMFTVKMQEVGFTFDSVDGDYLRGMYPVPTVYGAYDMVSKLSVPFIRRKAFFEPGGSSFDFGPLTAMRTIEYIRVNTDYNTDLIWDNLLRTVNQYDLKNWLCLSRSVPDDYLLPQKAPALKIAVVLHIYYIDLLPYCLSYLANFPTGTPVLITTDTREKVKTIKQSVSLIPERPFSIKLVENRGRDVSALLVGARSFIKEGGFELVCFMHDKKVPQGKYVSTGRLYADKCFQCVAASPQYVENIASMFALDRSLGICVPPPPTHETYYDTVGGSWTNTKNYNMALKLANELKLGTPIDFKKPPVAPYGTIFWFRPDALSPLFARHFEYEDFPEEPADNDSTIMHAIERLYPIVAQSRRYYPLIVMPPDYAASELTYAVYEAQQYLWLLNDLQPTTRHKANARIRRIAFYKAYGNHAKGGTRLGRGSLMTRADALDEQSVFKRFLKAITPMGLWEHMRRKKCERIGAKYITPFPDDRPGLKHTIKMCTPRFVWGGIRRLKYDSRALASDF